MKRKRQSIKIQKLKNKKPLRRKEAKKKKIRSISIRQKLKEKKLRRTNKKIYKFHRIRILKNCQAIQKKIQIWSKSNRKILQRIQQLFNRLIQKSQASLLYLKNHKFLRQSKVNKMAQKKARVFQLRQSALKNQRDKSFSNKTLISAKLSLKLKRQRRLDIQIH